VFELPEKDISNVVGPTDLAKESSEILPEIFNVYF
jgi:hypothetical protein